MEKSTTTARSNGSPSIAFISESTAKNWARLGASSDGRLTRRANKRGSKKRIVPKESFRNLENAAFVRELADEIERSGRPVFAAIKSLALGELRRRGLLRRRHIGRFLNDYRDVPIFRDLTEIPAPDDEIDFLGLVYQSLLLEGRKNAFGSYYTPRRVVENMIASFDFSKGQTFLDPCCGSGAFLLAANAPNPEQLFGVDVDEIAVFIAKVNLALKYSDKVFVPQVFCFDYLRDASTSEANGLWAKRFDCVATNPPWGALSERREKSAKNAISNETFSAFFVRAFGALKKNGTIRFLFPESILNVKAHRAVRSFILNQTRLVGITPCEGTFSGVSTKFVEIECSNAAPSKTFLYRDKNGPREVALETVFETKNLIFNALNSVDLEIVRRVKSRGVYSLAQSVWGMGIVTGDNKSKLSTTRLPGMEAIYTGKEIASFRLRPAKRFLLFDRANLQQAAKEEVYRVDEKLVYKFVSKKLVFAYDDSRSLFLNSANILVPKIPGTSIKTAAAFLNSALFRFFYLKMFGETKILQGNLLELPFPRISREDDASIAAKVDAILVGNASEEAAIQEKIFALYDLTPRQIQYVEKTVGEKKFF